MVDVLFVLDKFVAYELFQVSSLVAQLRDPIDNIINQVESVQIIQYCHIKRCCGCSFFFITTHVQVLMIGATIAKAMS